MNSSIVTYYPGKTRTQSVSSADANVVNLGVNGANSGLKYAGLGKATPGTQAPGPQKNSDRFETINFADGGKPLRIVLPEGSQKDVLDNNKIKLIEDTLAANKALNRPVVLQNKNPKARLTRNPKFHMVLRNSVMPAELPDGLDATFEGVTGPLPATNKSMNLTLNGTDFSNSHITNAHLEFHIVGGVNKMDNSNVDAVLKGDMPDMYNSHVNVRRGSDLHAAPDAGMRNSTLSGPGEVHAAAQMERLVDGEGRGPKAAPMTLVHASLDAYRQHTGQQRPELKVVVDNEMDLTAQRPHEVRQRPRKFDELAA